MIINMESASNNLIRWLLGPESSKYTDEALSLLITRMALEMAKWPFAILCALSAMVLTA